MDHILTSPWVGFPPYNQSPANCSGEPHRQSCLIQQDELAKRDLIAMVRGIVSLLSFLGSLSIIITVLVKRQVFSPKIHPIFMLSIADCLLSIMWIVGGALWLVGGAKYEGADRVGCFTITLCTVILECVAVNLTLLYALLAYYNIKQKDFGNVYLLFNREKDVHVWRLWKTLLAYAIAWLLPVALILVPVLSLSSTYHVMNHANNCSCWCLPYFGNVVPMAFAADLPTSHYLYRIKILIVCYSFVVGVNYLVGFICLSIIYWRILRRIKELRRDQVAGQRNSTQTLYGTLQSRVVGNGEKRAKTRVVAFLTAFVWVGFINMLIAFSFFVGELNDLSDHSYKVPYEPELTYFQLGLYLLQSSTLPMQGFLNALVYGWTREDFLKLVTGQNIQDLPPGLPEEDDPVGGSLENSQSIFVSSSSEGDTSSDDWSPEHRAVSHARHVSRQGFLDTVEEVTEPENSDEYSINFDGRPKSI